LNEKVHGKIFVTGNTVIDAIKHNIKLAEKKSTINYRDEDFVLLTIHRAENVDDKKTIVNIFKALIESKEKILFPIHPRTKKRLHEFNLYKKILNSKNIRMIPPVGYFDMLLLMKQSKFIISDSGGIQEESTSPQIKKKVLVIRKTTDRPEAVKAGMAELVGTSKNSILNSIKRFSKNPKFPKKPSPYGSGNASKKILNILNKF